MDWNKFFLYKLGTRDLCNEHQRPGLQGWPLPDRTTDGAKVWVYIGKPFWAILQFILLQRMSCCLPLEFDAQGCSDGLGQPCTFYFRR